MPNKTTNSSQGEGDSDSVAESRQSSLDLGSASASAPAGVTSNAGQIGSRDLQNLLKEFKRLRTPIDAIAGIKPGESDALERLEKALAKLAPSNAIAASLDKLRDEATRVIAAERKRRAAEFKRAEVDFIREAKQKHEVREAKDGEWRIDELKLKVRREQAQACFLYNEEIVLGWSYITTTSMLSAGLAEARRRLAEKAIPQDLLVATFRLAWDHARASRERAGKSDARVPLVDFYREVRVALVRAQVEGRKPETPLRHMDLPKWAFLYNADRYRQMGSSIGPEDRLGFQTGSQAEVSQGMGFVLNGLDPREDYKVFCYVGATSRS